MMFRFFRLTGNEVLHILIGNGIIRCSSGMRIHVKKAGLGAFRLRIPRDLSSNGRLNATYLRGPSSSERLNIEFVRWD